MQELGVGRWVVLVLLAYGCGDGSGESFDAGVDRGVREAGRPDAMLRDSEPPPELSCDLVGETLDEDWGPSESTGRTVACFDVRSDSDEEREEQVAYSSVPVAEGFGLVTSDRLVVIGADNRRVPAQFEVLARWGGPIADESRAIRWLGVSVPVQIDAGASHAYAILQQEDAPAQVRVAGDLSVEAGEGGLVINTGAALFTLAAAEPGLLRSVDLTGADGSTLRAYDSAIGDGSGPRLVLETGSGSTAIDSSASSGGEVVPDEGAELSLIASGPVRVVVAQSGHFVAADGVSRCEADPAAYEALGYTLLLTFSRGSSHVDVEFHFRNECSDLSFGPWTDQAARVRSLSLEFPLSLSAERNVFAAGSAELSSMASPSAEVAVEQRSGAYAGADWTRRARVRVGSASIEMGEEFSRPFAGVSDGVVGAYAFVPWMRFREPQAVAVGADRLSLRFVSESVVVGEARGIWNHARVGFGRSLELSDMQSHRAAAVSGLERSLLVHPTRTTLNGARVFPSVGDDSPSALREEYLRLLNQRHSDTIGPQRQAHNIYGSQIWPDIPFLAGDSPDPSIHSPKMNYWNASRTELLEFWRSGDVKWVWDWSMMQTWTQLFSAYANAGEHSHGNRNGFALTSGGCGWSNSCCHYPPPAPGDCSTAGEDETGHWHRSGQGSDDYTYTHGDVGYLVRPSHAMQRRFAQAGRTAIDRYPNSAEGREIYVSERSVVRQVIQHWVHLANCAEFVPGEEGRACDEHLRAILEELASDNLSAGVLCMRDDPGETSDPGTGLSEPANVRTCVVPQQFMQNALIVPFFYRLLLNYGDIGGQLRRATVGSVFHYYANGMGIPVVDRPTREGTERPPVPIGFDAVWTNQLQYTLSEDRSTVEECPLADGDGLITYDESVGASSPVDCALNPSSGADFGEEAMLFPNRPQTVGWLAVAGAMDPSLRLCAISRVALEDSDFLSLLRDYDTGQPDGWLKGPAQISQGLVFALGAYEACAAP